MEHGVDRRSSTVAAAAQMQKVQQEQSFANWRRYKNVSPPDLVCEAKRTSTTACDCWGTVQGPLEADPPDTGMAEGRVSGQEDLEMCLKWSSEKRQLVLQMPIVRDLLLICDSYE